MDQLIKASSPGLQFLHVVVFLFLLLGCDKRKGKLEGLVVVLSTHSGWVPGLCHMVSAKTALPLQPPHLQAISRLPLCA